jgi:hypothetical protein
LRARLAVLLALAATLSITAGIIHSPAHAQPLRVAQDDPGGDEEAEQRPAQPSDPESPSPSPTEEEAGPPWTYQMARISLLLLALLLLGMGAVYYRLVVKRQRGEV